jgi:hypothetical protein
MSNENEITQYAANVAPEFTFSGAGGSVDIVAGSSDRAIQAASSMLSFLEPAKNLAVQGALGGLVACSASAAALGAIDPTAAFVGAAAGAIGCFSKGTSR